MQTISKSKDLFRNDINALRAIAVMGVLFYHYDINYLKGGFAGVDVFFVISGYLMSKIILNGLHNNGFAYWDYLKKRYKRIVPALAILIITINLVCFFTYFPEDLRLIQKSAFASLLFISNIFYWTNLDYFAPAAEENIFLHTWSLSVEWQFYLLYPFLIVILKRVLVPEKYFFVFFILVTFILLVITLTISDEMPTASFYLLPTRAWEMMLGGVLVLFENKIHGQFWRKLLSLIGYTLIIFSFIIIDNSLLWPSVYTLLPVFATSIIILSNVQNFTLITNPLTQFLGKISYSIYLWHWPLYVYIQEFGLEITWYVVLLMTLCSIALGYLSFLFVESNKHLNFTRINIFVSFSVILIVILYFSNLSRFLYKKETLTIANYNLEHPQEKTLQYDIENCHVERFSDYNKQKCLNFKKNKRNFLLLGDSHMGQLAQSFKQKFSNSDINFLQITVNGTLPTLKNYEGKKAKHREFMDFAFTDFVPHNASKIDGVILTGNWAGKEIDGLDKNKILESINEVLLYFKNNNIPIIIIGQTEIYKISYLKIAARSIENNSTIPNSFLLNKPYEIDTHLNSHLKGHYIQVINKSPVPVLHPYKQPYFADEHHVTKYGAELLVNKILSDSIAKSFFKL